MLKSISFYIHLANPVSTCWWYLKGLERLALTIYIITVS
jgi:hypothetical protein